MGSQKSDFKNGGKAFSGLLHGSKREVTKVTAKMAEKHLVASSMEAKEKS